MPGTLLFDYPTLDAIAGFIVDELLGAALDARAAAPAARPTVASVASMTDAEAEAALLAELDDL